MAAVVRCDSCGECVDYKQAVHVRVYSMDSATTYKGSQVKETAELCSECHKKFKKLIGKEAK